MNWLDITALTLVLGGAFLGWRNGLLRWAFMLAGTIAGAILAGQFYTDLEMLAQGAIDSEALRQTIAFSVIFIGTLLAALLLSFVAEDGLEAVAARMGRQPRRDDRRRPSWSIERVGIRLGAGRCALGISPNGGN